MVGACGPVDAVASCARLPPAKWLALAHEARLSEVALWPGLVLSILVIERMGH